MVVRLPVLPIQKPASRLIVAQLTDMVERLCGPTPCCILNFFVHPLFPEFELHVQKWVIFVRCRPCGCILFTFESPRLPRKEIDFGTVSLHPFHGLRQLIDLPECQERCREKTTQFVFLRGRTRPPLGKQPPFLLNIIPCHPDGGPFFPSLLRRFKFPFPFIVRTCRCGLPFDSVGTEVDMGTDLRSVSPSNKWSKSAKRMPVPPKVFSRDPDHAMADALARLSGKRSCVFQVIVLV